MLIPGEEILVPHKDYYLLCQNDEEGFTWSYCRLPSGESCPTSYFAAKPVDWYYGNMHFDANFGVDTLWPKDLEKGHDAPAADIRIFYWMQTRKGIFGVRIGRRQRSVSEITPFPPAAAQ